MKFGYPASYNAEQVMILFDKGNHHIGQLVKVRIIASTSATLLGEAVE